MRAAGRRCAAWPASGSSWRRHQIAGDVHGMGLYLGLDLVRDPRDQGAGAARRRSRSASASASAAPSVAADGRGENVLKLKPPLVFEQRDADWLVATLDDVLTRGW